MSDNESEPPPNPCCRRRRPFGAPNQLASLTLMTFEEGDIALFASADMSGGAEVHFDNLVVSEP